MNIKLIVSIIIISIICIIGITVFILHSSSNKPSSDADLYLKCLKQKKLNCGEGCYDPIIENCMSDGSVCSNSDFCGGVAGVTDICCKQADKKYCNTPNDGKCSDCPKPCLQGFGCVNGECKKTYYKMTGYNIENELFDQLSASVQRWGKQPGACFVLISTSYEISNDRSIGISNLQPIPHITSDDGNFLSKNGKSSFYTFRVDKSVSPVKFTIKDKDTKIQADYIFSIDTEITIKDSMEQSYVTSTLIDNPQWVNSTDYSKVNACAIAYKQMTSAAVLNLPTPI